jgi:hypothetical protein
MGLIQVDKVEGFGWESDYLKAHYFLVGKGEFD